MRKITGREPYLAQATGRVRLQSEALAPVLRVRGGRFFSSESPAARRRAIGPVRFDKGTKGNGLTPRQAAYMIGELHQRHRACRLSPSGGGDHGEQRLIVCHRGPPGAASQPYPRRRSRLLWTSGIASIAIMIGRLRRTSIGRIGAVSMGSAGSTGSGSRH